MSSWSLASTVGIQSADFVPKMAAFGPVWPGGRHKYNHTPVIRAGINPHYKKTGRLVGEDGEDAVKTFF